MKEEIKLIQENLSKAQNSDEHNFQRWQQAEVRIKELELKLAEQQALIRAIPKIIADASFGNPPEPKWEVSHITVLRAEADYYETHGKFMFGGGSTELQTLLDRSHTQGYLKGMNSYNWISISNQKKPSFGEYVFVMTTDADDEPLAVTACYNGNDLYLGWDGKKVKPVTHWMKIRPVDKKHLVAL